MTKELYMGWFEVSKDGLAKVLEKRGKAFAIFELIQNAWDQNVTMVEIILEPITNRAYAHLIVRDDDPAGFKDLSHAYTLYAESSKKGDPERRGVWNRGEKLVLALCESAVVSTTKGTVTFDKDGRHESRKGRKSGTEIHCIIKMKREEFYEAEKLVHKLIPPSDIITTFNGRKLTSRTPLKSFVYPLPTIVADREGYLKNTVRKTEVEIYEIADDEVGFIYEMGIPVVETGDKYHINVQQKVPLNMDRDNVTPGYLQILRVCVLNEMHDALNEEEANDDWVRNSTNDKRCSKDATQTVMDHRFTKKRVAYDPKDPESNAAAFADGATVVYPRQMTRQERRNAKEANALISAGKKYPRKIVFNSSQPAMTDEELTDGMKIVRQYAKELAQRLMKVRLQVYFLNANGLNATYERDDPTHGKMVFYVKSLEKRAKQSRISTWFDLNNDDVTRLVIHELGHHFGHHLQNSYHEALCDLASQSVRLALKEPKFYGRYGFRLPVGV